MNHRVKWGLIISGYVLIFVLIFIVTGGLAALLDLIQEIKEFSEMFIKQIIEVMFNHDLL